jgi:hypothetical protein
LWPMACLARHNYRVDASPTEARHAQHRTQSQHPAQGRVRRAGPSGSAAAIHQTAQCWDKAIENLYVTYAAQRAAKSLRDAEEARMLEMLQRRSARAYA